MSNRRKKRSFTGNQSQQQPQPQSQTQPQTSYYPGSYTAPPTPPIAPGDWYYPMQAAAPPTMPGLPYTPLYFYYPYHHPYLAAAAATPQNYSYYIHPLQQLQPYVQPQHTVMNNHHMNYDRFPHDAITRQASSTGNNNTTPAMYANDQRRQNLNRFRRDSSTTNLKPELSIPRGPPHKPAQSGYALWVGNLPTSVTFAHLLRLFGNMQVISIFLIQQTNCAFVNYSSEAAVDKVVAKRAERGYFVLKGRELVVRKQVAPKETTDTENGHSNTTTTTTGSSSSNNNNNEEFEVPERDPDNRYFICKSLTMEDLLASVRLGIWSTQPHNEQQFNEAFEQAENVYLFFSANRTGEFHGYARMESAIDANLETNGHATQPTPSQPRPVGAETTPSPESSQASLALSPRSTASNCCSNTSSSSTTNNNNPQPKVTPTRAGDGVPAGRIVDDSARGSLFWEVTEPQPAADIKKKPNSCTFKIKWLSEHPVAFTQTAHLRNRFNDNKPVKVARDGTEIEPQVGQELIQLFV